MKIIVWNLKGINKPFKQKEVRRIIKRLKIDMICILGTRVHQDNANRIKNSIAPGWDFVHNYSVHSLGRIWFCWDPSVYTINFVRIHEQVITCGVVSDQGRLFWFQSVYSATNGLERRKMLQELSSAKALIGCTLGSLQEILM